MYFKNLQAKEAEYINALIVGCVEGAFLNGNDNNEFVSKIENLFNGFISEEENIIKSFNDFIETAVNNLLNNIQLFFDEISKLNTQITSTFTKYHNDFDLLFEEAKNKGITHSNNLKAEIELQIKNNELANESLYKSRCEEVKEKIVIIEKEFVDREEVIKLTEEKQKEEYLSDYEQILKDRENAKLKIEESYVARANAYLREYEDKVKTLNEKFVILQENVDKEYKTKMGLL